jgi:hypothetical protein
MSVAEHDDEPVQIGIGSDRAVRLAVLEAAAQFAADRDEIKSADVLRIAESWLAWVER